MRGVIPSTQDNQPNICQVWRHLGSRKYVENQGQGPNSSSYYHILSEWILADMKNSLSIVEIFGATSLNFCDLTHWTFFNFITNV